MLTCIDNFQEYILENIKQLVKLGHKRIYVITNEFLQHHFEPCKNDIQLLFIESLGEEKLHFKNNTQLDSSFRNGFWMLTSYRFFLLYEFIKLYDLQNVIHLENDVLIYYHCDVLLDKLDKRYVYMHFDSWKRNVASIVYIPNKDIYHGNKKNKILDNNFDKILNKTNQEETNLQSNF